MTTIQPQSTIIYQAQRDDNAYYAAMWLRDKLRFAYGVSEGFNVVNYPPADANALTLQIGPNEPDADVDPYGFIIQKDGNRLRMYGRTYEPGLGIIHQNNLMGAVTHFLDEYCGIRQYIPTDEWISRPNLPVSLPDTITEKVNPFAYQTFGTGIEQNSYLWARAHGYYNRLGDTHQHTLGYLYNQAGNPDIADPATLEKAKTWVDTYFASKPYAPYVALTIMDTDAFPDTEGIRKALSESAGSITEVMISFVRELAAYMARKHPRKKLLHLAYASVRSLPANPLPANVVSILVQRIAEMDAKGSLFLANGTNPASIPDWLSASDSIGLHDWAQGVGYLTPRLYTSQYHKLFRYLFHEYRSLYYLYMECYPNYGLDGPKYWLMNKLNMSPQSGYNTLLFQFCEDMFGEASSEMFQYFLYLERLSLSMQNNVVTGLKKMYNYWGQFRINKREYILLNICRQYLDLAIETNKDPLVGHRIAFLERSFTLSERLLQSQYLPSLPKDFAAQTVAHAQLVQQDRLAFYHNLGGSLVDQVKEALNATTYMKPTS